mmetsp:Transcript_21850/g.44289  ORF Transcript_21850/g.44289 Transcript_21850/m.44289 type:complete len:243 (+) Transcript_21850:75-803(+)
MLLAALGPKRPRGGWRQRGRWIHSRRPLRGRQRLGDSALHRSLDLSVEQHARGGRECGSPGDAGRWCRARGVRAAACGAAGPRLLARRGEAAVPAGGLRRPPAHRSLCAWGGRALAQRIRRAADAAVRVAQRVGARPAARAQGGGDQGGVVLPPDLRGGAAGREGRAAGRQAEALEHWGGGRPDQRALEELAVAAIVGEHVLRHGLRLGLAVPGPHVAERLGQPAAPRGLCVSSHSPRARAV